MRAAAPDPAELTDEVVKSTLGLDSAKLLVSGAAPIRPDVLEFFGAMGVEICEGYGMTESTGVGAVNVPGRVKIGTVGPASGRDRDRTCGGRRDPDPRRHRHGRVPR